MQLAELSSNPFALMMAPEAIFAAIDKSERLNRLQSRICRPLDAPRPVLSKTEVGSFDAAVDESVDAPEPIDDFEPSDLLDSVESLDGFDKAEIFGD